MDYYSIWLFPNGQMEEQWDNRLIGIGVDENLNRVT